MRNAPVIIVGAGGHAVVVADALLAAGRTVLGFVDGDPAKLGTWVLGLPVLGDDAALNSHRDCGIELVNGIGGPGTTSSAGQVTLRRRVQHRLSALGWTFAAVRHPGAIVSPSAELGPSAHVLAGAVVQPCAQVGDGAIVNTRAVIEHHTHVGVFAHIAPAAVLCGEVWVGEEAHVGAGAVVRQGIHLAARVMVAAGAAVVRDVHEGVVAGVPARARPHSVKSAT
ncbi:MAG: NeuD/PglB/VioB family sugar acetyltransferase [Betaproteobacteria bacterium]